jgi:hypothetical protein
MVESACFYWCLCHSLHFLKQQLTFLAKFKTTLINVFTHFYKFFLFVGALFGFISSLPYLCLGRKRVVIIV